LQQKQQVQMYCGSAIVAHAQANDVTHMHMAGGRCSSERRAAWRPTSWKYDVISKIIGYSFNWCVFTCIAEQSCQISSRSHMKRQSLRLFEQRRPNKQKEEEQVAW